MTPSAEARAAKAVPRRLRRRLVALAAFAVALGTLMVAPAMANDPGAAPASSPLLVAQTTPAPQPPPATPGPAATPPSTPAPGATPVLGIDPGPDGWVPEATPIAGCPHPVPEERPTYPPDYPWHANQPLPMPLCPAEITGADPLSPLAWAFTPIFQALFLGLVAFYNFTGDIGIAIILLTIAIKTLLLPLFRRQIVAQRRMQMLQPEIRAIQQKFKGNRNKISEETMRLYRDRGVNPAAGCLPMVLQLFLLLPIYQVVNQGLRATEISSMLQVFGQPLIDVVCHGEAGTFEPCLNPSIWWLGGLDAHEPAVLFSILGFIHISALAGLAALLQFIQTRMMMPPSNDPQARAQQRVFMFLPLLVLLWGFLPAGLFIYWSVFSAYSIVQQYFIAGWGSLFPIFGWTPGFARDHQPRFPVDIAPPSKPAGGEGTDKESAKRSPTDRAAGTIRPARQRGRTSRRGRRR